MNGTAAKLVLLGSLYLAQGLPHGFFSTAVPALLRRQGLSLTEIGLAMVVMLSWGLKFLWAPVVDRVGSARFGRRRSWILPLQLGTIAGLLALSTVAAIALPGVARANGYAQVNLVSDLPGIAQFQDTSLVNPWGISHSGGSPFWVSDQATGVSTLYNTGGVKQGLTVTIPGGSPTGQVFNGTAGDFMGDKFIVDSEDGTILGWQTQGDPFVLRVDNSADSAYKGLALIKNGDRIRIDANARRIDVLVDENELKRRRAAWVQPEPRHKAGLLAKYAQSVGQADAGAVTHAGGVIWPEQA